MASTSYVYVTANTDDSVRIALTCLGPNDPGATLNSAQIASNASQVCAAAIPRHLSGDMHLLDFAFSVGTDYIASLQILMKGHGGAGSMIWWRWTAAIRFVMAWATDHGDHSTTISARGRNYKFTIAGAPSFLGYDDVYVTIASA